MTPILEVPRIVFEVLAFTDEPMAAAGLRRLLAASSVVKLLSIHDSLTRLEAALGALRPRVLLLDLTPCVTLRVILSLREQYPDCRAVLWVRNLAPLLARQAVLTGVCGILRKTAPAAACLTCLEVVARGGLWFEEALRRDGGERGFARLSQREGQLVRLVSSGLKNKEVAESLGVSEASVKVRLSRLFRKLGVDGRTKLTMYALRNASMTEASLDPSAAFGEPTLWPSVPPTPWRSRLGTCLPFSGWHVRTCRRLPEQRVGNPSSRATGPAAEVAISTREA